MSFQVPFPSSPPTTPGKSSNRVNGDTSIVADHPSTTPAGPPPPSVFSTTPAGPPPSSTFASSNNDTRKSLFPTSKAPATNGTKALFNRTFKTSPKTLGAGRGSAKLGNGTVNAPRFLGAHRVETTESASASEIDDEDEDEDAEGEEYEEDEDAEGEEEEEEDDEDDEEYDEEEDESYTQEDADMDEEEQSEDDEEDYDEDASNASHHSSEDEGTENGRESTPKPFVQPLRPGLTASTGSTGAFDWQSMAADMEPEPPSSTGLSSHGTKRSRGASLSLAETIEADLPPAKRRESALPRIAKDIARTSTTAGLDDSDGVIIGTEQILSRLVIAGRAPPMAMDYERNLEKALEDVPRALVRLWRGQARQLEFGDVKMEPSIGPTDDSDGFTKAAFLASILLRLYHPASASSPKSQSSRRGSLRHSTSLMRLNDNSAEPYPRVLLDFLDGEHVSFEQSVKALYNFRPNPTASPKFWDIIAAAVLRGHFEKVHKIFHIADFKYSWKPREEGSVQLGYSGSQLDLIHRTIGRFAEVLAVCPVLEDGDWEVSGTSWSVFRRRCDEALSELSSGSSSRALFPLSGLESSASRLPERIYSNLKVLYGILLGRPDEIMSVSLDWLEATVGLTVWWNGEDDVGPVSLKASRRSNLGRSGGGRVVDISPGAAYRRRLAYAVDLVTNGTGDDMLAVNTANSVEVGLASIFEENIEGALGIIQTWSLPVTSAVLEVARWAGWYETPPSGARPEGFDDSDLMVLSYARPDRGLTKDDVNLSYSDLLFEKATLNDGKSSKEGWQLAIDASYRLEDPSAAQRRIAWLISRVSIESSERADKVADICDAFGMSEESKKACESFADYVSTNSHNYGIALVYYARAHAAKKCKDVLDLLISMCLVRSAAYPPSLPDKSSRGADAQLATLIASPQSGIQAATGQDREAANILSEYISGYATLRRFYDLRDQDVNPSTTTAGRPPLRPKARLRAAAKAILACISSAADSIQGGLYDASVTSVIQVDVLLALLAEAGEFLGREERVLSMPQLMAFLRAIEDLQTVHERIRQQAEDCFQACLETRWDGNAIGNRLDPSELLKKSVSGLTDTSGFSLIGSELSETGSSNIGKSMVRQPSSDVQRAWDWRDRWKAGTTTEQVLRSLRQAVAQEIAAMWIEDV